MNTPGWRLHSLKGKRHVLWAIDVNKNWRIVFEFRDGNAGVGHKMGQYTEIENILLSINCNSRTV